MHRLWLVCILLACTACTVSESGDVEFIPCPSCAHAYDGFERCAFFDAEKPWAREGMLIDDEQSIEVGTAIRHAGYMHHKFCFNKTHAAFGSANPTRTGLTSNANYVIRMQSAALASAFQSEYSYLQGEGSGRHPDRWLFNDRPVEVLFCPRDGCEERVLAILSQANDTIRFLAFSFTSDAVGDALVAASLRGVRVEGVMEPWGATSRYSEYERLVERGIPITLSDRDGLMHAKAFLIDDRIAITGSYNPTASGTNKNAETVVVTREPAVLGGLAALHADLR